MLVHKYTSKHCAKNSSVTNKEKQAWLSDNKSELGERVCHGCCCLTWKRKLPASALQSNYVFC